MKKKIVTFYDGKIIVAGLLIFLLIITIPVWFALISREGADKPELNIDTKETQCVESTQYMREKHMQLLNEWRNLAVRDGVTVYTSSNGNEYDISLSGSCLECHGDKQQFCDQCHSYVGSEPDCWNCHINPGEDD